MSTPLAPLIAAYGRLRDGEAGQSLAEFGLVLALVAVICVVAVTLIGLAVLSRFVGIETALG